MLVSDYLTHYPFIYYQEDSGDLDHVMLDSMHLSIQYIMDTLFQKASTCFKARSAEDQLFLQKWLFQLEVFSSFSLQQNSQLVNLLDTFRLNQSQRVQFEEGIEFCFVCKGKVSMELMGTDQKLLKRKNRKEMVEQGSWVVGKKFSGKACQIEGIDEQSQIVFLSSEKAKKLIGKKQQTHWANLATIIQRQSLFKYLDKDTLLDIASDAKVKVLPYNNCLYNRGDEANFGYVLLEGNVMILNQGVQVSLLNPEQVLGDEEILQGKVLRSFKAVIVSSNAKILIIGKQKITSALAVLTVLGRQKEVDIYLKSKYSYREQITKSVKKYMSSLSKVSSQKRLSKEAMPYFKLSKKPSIEINNPSDPEENFNPQQANILPLRLLTSKRSSVPTIIRSKELAMTPKPIQYQSTQIINRRLSMLPFINR